MKKNNLTLVVAGIFCQLSLKERGFNASAEDYSHSYDCTCYYEKTLTVHPNSPKFCIARYLTYDTFLNSPLLTQGLWNSPRFPVSLS